MSRSYTSSSPWRLHGVAGQFCVYIKSMVRNAVDLSSSERRPVMGSCEHGNKLSSSMKSLVYWQGRTADITPFGYVTNLGMDAQLHRDIVSPLRNNKCNNNVVT
jgi:hypothetical protein